MLVLSRNVGEELIINGNIRVVIVAVDGDKAKIGIDAPRDVVVDRQEIHQRKLQENQGETAPRQDQ